MPFMSVWSRFAKMDSALQRGLDNSFAFVFGGKLVATEIEEALKQCAEDEAITTYAGYSKVPSGYIVAVSTKDYNHLYAHSPRLPWDYADRLTRFFRNQGWRTDARVTVTITADEGLHTGQLKTACTSAGTRNATGFMLSTDDDISSPAPPRSQRRNPDAPADPPPTSSAYHGAAAGMAGAAAPKPVVGDAAVSTETTVLGSRGTPWEAWEQEMQREPTVTLLLRDGSSRTYHVEHGSTIIGRSHDANFRLPDTGVSRQHAEMTWDGHDAVIVDLQSTNGTMVNGMPVDNWLLADGDVITVGHSTIEVRITQPQR